MVHRNPKRWNIARVSSIYIDWLASWYSYVVMLYIGKFCVLLDERESDYIPC